MHSLTCSGDALEEALCCSSHERMRKTRPKVGA